MEVELEVEMAEATGVNGWKGEREGGLGSIV